MKKTTRRPAAPKATHLPARGQPVTGDSGNEGAPDWMAAGGGLTGVDGRRQPKSVRVATPPWVH